ncbi:MAG: ABC transporter substrate-binding protein [Polyangiaceae bacterium]|nr:ABC transporter substrate-binding protein [Polyangiaceae bacterium]
MVPRRGRRVRRRDVLAAGAGAVLAGCGRDDAGGVPLWFSYGGKNREALLALVDRFNREEPEHRLSAVYQGDYFELLAKLRTAIHAGRAPAVTHVVAEILPYLAHAEVLEPLDSIAALQKDFGFVPELTQNGAFSGDKNRPVYALPFNRSTPIAYLNGSILKELGLAPPTTWDELETFALAATKGKEGERRYGFSCPIDWWFWVALVAQAGGELVDADNRFILGADAGVEALQFLQRLVHELEVMRPPSGRDYNAWQVQNQEFIAGRVAMIWNSTAFVRYLEDNAKFPVVCAPLPKRDRFGVPTGGTMFVLPKAKTGRMPAHWQEAGARFLAFMARPDTSNEFATKTGYIPVTRAGVELLETSGYYEKKPNDRVAVEQLRHVKPWPWNKELFRVQREVVQSRLEACVLSREDPMATIQAAQHVIAEGP